MTSTAIDRKTKIGLQISAAAVAVAVVGLVYGSTRSVEAPRYAAPPAPANLSAPVAAVPTAAPAPAPVHSTGLKALENPGQWTWKNGIRIPRVDTSGVAIDGPTFGEVWPVNGGGVPSRLIVGQDEILDVPKGRSMEDACIEKFGHLPLYEFDMWFRPVVEEGKRVASRTRVSKPNFLLPQVSIAGLPVDVLAQVPPKYFDVTPVAAPAAAGPASPTPASSPTFTAPVPVVIATPSINDGGIIGAPPPTE